MFKYNTAELKILAIIKKLSKKQNPFACTVLDIQKHTGYSDAYVKDSLRVLEATERIEWNTNARKKPVITFIK
jgi:DNA-binding MarR family transcriptional regulator